MKKSTKSKSPKSITKRSPKPQPKASKPTAAKPVKSTKAPKASTKSQPPRAATNPFRQGSAYGVCYDILAAHPEGMPRQQLITDLAKASGKPIKNAAYDSAIVLSARPDFRHTCCRPGFIIKRENDNVRLEVTAAPTKAK